MRKDPLARCRERAEGHLLSRDTAAAETGLHAPRRAQEVANPGAQSCEGTARNPGARHPEPTGQDQAGTRLLGTRTSPDWQGLQLEARALVKTCCEVAKASRTAQSSVPASRSHTVSHLVKVMGSPSQRNPKPASGIRRTPFLSTVRVSPAMRNRALKLHCPAWQVHVQATTVQNHRNLAPEATIRFEQGCVRTRTGQCAQDPEQIRPLLIEIRP